MKLFKKLEWPIFDLTMFKWSTASAGVILGAYCSDFIKEYVFIFAFIFVVTTARVIYFYYIKNK